jgi:hypothetical protein
MVFSAKYMIKVTLQIKVALQTSVSELEDVSDAFIVYVHNSVTFLTFHPMLELVLVLLVLNRAVFPFFQMWQASLLVFPK